ncbi:hypothetical protein [Mucilaginibacter sp.]|uniref:hypothetical protein n=1 Tax=Mucilaginibacter sp. TaxID=1882438 RepID=UPI0035BC52CB
MKKFTFIVFILLALKAGAQTTPTKTFSVGLELGLPTNSIYNIGLGGSGKMELPIVAPVALTFTAGYTSFYYKSALIGSNASQSPAGFVPLKAGGKFYFSPGIYIEADAGTVIETNYNKNKLFVFDAGPGFVFATGKHSGIDFGIRYENWGGGRLRQTALRVAYRLGW